MTKLRTVIGTVALGAALAVLAGSALGDNIKLGGGGPPFVSGNAKGALVFHCVAFGGKSVAVFTPNGRIHGNCRV